MKNLKRILALTVVVATLLGMMTFASAKKEEFSDGYSISKLEAVEVLVSMGVINGYTDGSFKPFGTVTRAEMATMISKLLNKGETIADSWASACTFADMKGVEWAAPHVVFF